MNGGPSKSESDEHEKRQQKQVEEWYLENHGKFLWKHRGQIKCNYFPGGAEYLRRCPPYSENGVLLPSQYIKLFNMEVASHYTSTWDVGYLFEYIMRHGEDTQLVSCEVNAYLRECVDCQVEPELQKLACIFMRIMWNECAQREKLRQFKEVVFNPLETPSMGKFANEWMDVLNDLSLIRKDVGNPVWMVISKLPQKFIRHVEDSNENVECITAVLKFIHQFHNKWGKEWKKILSPLECKKYAASLRQMPRYSSTNTL